MKKGIKKSFHTVNSAVVKFKDGGYSSSSAMGQSFYEWVPVLLCKQDKAIVPASRQHNPHPAVGFILLCLLTDSYQANMDENNAIFQTNIGRKQMSSTCLLDSRTHSEHFGKKQ